MAIKRQPLSCFGHFLSNSYAGDETGSCTGVLPAPLTEAHVDAIFGYRNNGPDCHSVLGFLIPWLRNKQLS